MSDAILQVKHLSKSFGSHQVLKDIDFTVRPGDVTSIIGASGSGKSTLLRCINLLETPSAGDILFHGENITARGFNPCRYRSQVGMVFQSFNLFNNMTVLENCMVGQVKVLKKSKAEAKENAMKYLEQVGMAPYINARPRQISGGQRQRVAIGRAIVREPKVFLMDEPLSNLDAKLRNQMRAEIIKLRKRIDTTFIYVTHDQTEAMTLGDRIVIMKDGYIQQVGTPQEVFGHPINTFVASFIGTPQMNFFDAKLENNGGAYQVDCGGMKVQLPNEVQAKLKANGVAAGDIVLGIRPEHIQFVEGGKGNALTGQVDVSEMMGSEIHLHISTSTGDGAAKDVVMRVSTNDLPSQYRNGIPYGTQISFSFPGALVHLFDKETERNLI